VEAEAEVVVAAVEVPEVSVVEAVALVLEEDVEAVDFEAHEEVAEAEGSEEEQGAGSEIHCIHYYIRYNFFRYGRLNYD